MRSPVIERLMVRGLQVALKHVIHDMETRTLVMELRRCAIKRCVPCGDMDRRLKIPHSPKVECGFRIIPEECLYDSGLYNQPQGCQLSRIWRDSHAFDLLLTQLTNLLTHLKEITRILTQFYKIENNLLFLIIVTFVRLSVTLFIDFLLQNHSL